MIIKSPNLGRGYAIAGFVCGLVAVILECTAFFVPFVTAVIGFVLGVVGIIMSSMANRKGNNSGIRTAGMVLGILGVIFGILMVIENALCVACLI